MTPKMHLNAHERPPGSLREVYKKFQKCTETDFAALDSAHISNFRKVAWLDKTTLDPVFAQFMGRETHLDEVSMSSKYCGFAYESTDVQGLLLVPGLIPTDIQQVLLSRTFHRDLSDATHNTNIDLHYQLERPAKGQSFFQFDPAVLIPPKNPLIHKPLSIKQLLSKKLRWMTLGGQYDWTRKVYPNEKPPDFPADLKELLLGLFPETDAQAAIVNLYSPGDTLSLHRDVSEECDRGLISLSIGCDCLFVIGYEDEHAPNGFVNAVLRLRSGDVVLMTGRSRYAWHGVPLIIPNTCPDELQLWPKTSYSTGNILDDQNVFEQWTDWMSSKRVNLNVRQMRSM